MATQEELKIIDDGKTGFTLKDGSAVEYSKVDGKLTPTGRTFDPNSDYVRRVTGYIAPQPVAKPMIDRSIGKNQSSSFYSPEIKNDTRAQYINNLSQAQTRQENIAAQDPGGLWKWNEETQKLELAI